mgnify:FL=1
MALIKKQEVKELVLWIEGVSGMVQHKWSEKAKGMMRDKHAGVKTKNRDKRDPENECKQAAYIGKESGKFGVPADAIKACIINAAHKDIGIEKTMVRKSLFVVGEDFDVTEEGRELCIMDTDDPIMREDTVRVGQGGTDLRYRPEFRNWRVKVGIEVDGDSIPEETLLNLIDRAGFGCGLGEMRPEKGGGNGRFRVDYSVPIKTRKRKVA